MSLYPRTLPVWMQAVALLIAASAAVAAGPPERDLWYSISDGSTQYGSVHIAARRMADGNFEYVSTARLQVELLGTRQTTSMSATLLVAPDLTPLQLDAEVEQMSGRSRLHGRADGAGFVIETEQGGEKTTRTFSSRTGLVFNLTLGEWLHRLASQADADDEPAKSHRIEVLSAESGMPVECTALLVHRDANGSVWSIKADQQWSETTYRFDADGILLEQHARVPPMRVTLTNRETAERIEYRRMPDRELLIFPFDRELPISRRLRRLDLRLEWLDIPLEEFNLEDLRQKVTSSEEKDGRQSAMIRIERPVFTTDSPLPLPRHSFEEALGETDFIKPHDERITAVVNDIVDEQMSALEATRAICKWVSEYIRPAMIAETLSGPDVLERKTGKCTEYSTLFASLARAAGIPTRIVLGQRRFAGGDGDFWGGHMWNEAFVGEWVPVDASANEVGGSFDLIKFVHSDTVMGTQPLRWKLTESLEISIADVEALPGATDTTQASGLDGRTYTSAKYGIRFDLPGDDWTIDDQSAPSAMVLRLRAPAGDLGDSVMIHMTGFNVPPGIGPRMVLDARLGHHRSGLTDFEVLLDEATQINGASAHRISFTGRSPGEGGEPLRVTEVLAVQDGSAALLNLISTVDLHEQYIEFYERILATLRFLED